MNTNIRLMICIASAFTAGAVVGCDIGDQSLGEGGGEVCSAMEDEPRPDTFRTVRVINTTDAPLWLPGHDCLDFTRFYMVVDGVPAVDNPGEEGLHCHDILSTSTCPSFGCEGDSEIGGIIRLGPGESYEFEWRTYAYHQLELPASCTAIEGANCSVPLSCYAGRNLEEGSEVTMRISAFSECSDELACACATGETCELPQGLYTLSGDTITSAVSFTFALDDDGVIELELTP